MGASSDKKMELNLKTEDKKGTHLCKQVAQAGAAEKNDQRPGFIRHHSGGGKFITSPGKEKKTGSGKGERTEFKKSK